MIKVWKGLKPLHQIGKLRSQIHINKDHQDGFIFGPRKPWPMGKNTTQMHVMYVVYWLSDMKWLKEKMHPKSCIASLMRLEQLLLSLFVWKKSLLHGKDSSTVNSFFILWGQIELKNWWYIDLCPHLE